jgi:hypothetical protein
MIDGLVEQRASTRLDSGFNVAFELQTVSYNAELVNLSREGAQIQIRHGLMPPRGATVRVAFMDGRTHTALVVWTGQTECGLRFDEPISNLEEMMHFDDLGSEFYRSVLKLQICG